MKVLFLSSIVATAACLVTGQTNNNTSTTESSLEVITIDDVPQNFIISEKGDKESALARYKETLAWREENDMVAILTEPKPYYDIISSKYLAYLYGNDKTGNPVYYEKIGKISLSDIEDAGVSHEALLRHYLFAMEYMLHYVCTDFDTCKATLVFDLEDLSIFSNLSLLKFVKSCISIMEDHYPNRNSKIFVINASWTLRKAYKKLIRPFLKTSVQERLTFVSSDDIAEELLTQIPAEELPVEYGGSNTTPLEESPYQIQRTNFVHENQ